MAFPSAKTPLAWFYIILLLSTHPLEARRRLEIRSAMSSLAHQESELNDLLVELDSAVVEAQIELGTISNITMFGAPQVKSKGRGADDENLKKCLKYKADFQNASSRAEKEIWRSEGKGRDRLSLKSSARVTLELRKMAKTANKGHSRHCTWLTDGSVDTAAIANVAKHTASGPCFDRAKTQLEGVRGKGKTQRAAAVFDAIGTMMSNPETCQPGKLSNIGVPSLLDNVSEISRDSESESGGLEGNLSSSIAGTGSLLQAWESVSVDGRMALESSVGEVVTLVGALVAFLAFLLSIALCVLSVWIFVLIMGVIWCAIVFLFKMMVRLFKKSSSKPNYPTCLRYFWDISVKKEFLMGTTAACAGAAVMQALGITVAVGGVAIGAL